MHHERVNMINEVREGGENKKSIANCKKCLNIRGRRRYYF
ncbi:putative hypothetical protein [Clostridium botulinum BKT015925]|nr:putative hypothetical protein [Clostridium botulinum BKT015925]